MRNASENIELTDLNTLPDGQRESFNGYGYFKDKDEVIFRSEFVNGKANGRGEIDYSRSKKFSGVVKDFKPWTGVTTEETVKGIYVINYTEGQITKRAVYPVDSKFKRVELGKGINISEVINSVLSSVRESVRAIAISLNTKETGRSNSRNWRPAVSTVAVVLSAGAIGYGAGSLGKKDGEDFDFGNLVSGIEEAFWEVNDELARAIYGNGNTETLGEVGGEEMPELVELVEEPQVTESSGILTNSGYEEIIDTKTIVGKIENDKGIYEGEILNGQKNGKGTFKFKNGDIYLGEFLTDKLNGVGNYTSVEGKVTAGIWKDDVLVLSNNKAGSSLELEPTDTIGNNAGTLQNEPQKVYVQNLEIKEVKKSSGPFAYESVKDISGMYTGEMVNGKREGKGKMSYNEGYTYEGDWHNDKPDGSGIFKDIVGTYNGEIKNGLPHGKGEYVYNKFKGATFEGNYIHGRRYGSGVVTFYTGVKLASKDFRESGNTFFTAVDGLRGSKITTVDCTNTALKCIWGPNIYPYIEFPQQSSKNDPTKKIGTWFDVAFNRQVYSGEYTNDTNKEGEGKLYFEDGGYIEGRFKDNSLDFTKKNRYVYPDGVVFEFPIGNSTTTWEWNMRKVRANYSIEEDEGGIYILPNGEKYNGSWYWDSSMQLANKPSLTTKLTKDYKAFAGSKKLKRELESHKTTLDKLKYLAVSLSTELSKDTKDENTIREIVAESEKLIPTAETQNEKSMAEVLKKLAKQAGADLDE